MSTHRTGTTARSRQDIRAKTARALLLSTELDRARLRCGFTTRQLADQMTMSPAMINRIMNGRRIPDALELGGLCALLDIPPHRRAHLYTLRRHSDDTDWIIHADTATRDPHDVVRSLWSLADEITTYATTTDSPRVLGNSDASTPRTGPGHRGVTLWTHYLTATALDRTTGEPEALEVRLARLARLDGVRIIPHDATPPFHHPVQVLHFRTFSPVVVLDLDFTTLILERGNAALYVDALRPALASALPIGASRNTIARSPGGTG